MSNPSGIASSGPPLERLLKVTTVADQLDMSPRAVWTLIAAGELKTMKVARRSTRVPESEVVNFIERCARKARAGQ